jgi:hypothetical protein
MEKTTVLPAWNPIFSALIVNPLSALILLYMANASDKSSGLFVGIIMVIAAILLVIGIINFQTTGKFLCFLLLSLVLYNLYAIVFSD